MCVGGQTLFGGSWDTNWVFFFVKLQFKVQTSVLGLVVDFVSPCHNGQIPINPWNISPSTHGTYPQQHRTLTKIYRVRPGVNCHWWSPTFPRVTHNLKNCRPPSPGWSTSIHRIVTHHPQDGHPPSPGWSPTILRSVFYYP